MAEEKVLKIVKSKFNGMCELLQKAWLIILLFIFLIIPTIIYGTYFLYILSIVVFIIVLSIYMFFRCEQYKAFEYVFYKDKLKFNSNFFNVENKTIKYNNIIEVKYKQSVIQRFFGLGDIIINTSAENGLNNGITITSVKNVENLYEEINLIVNK
jgi:uncharacterized membrane protein YdbT with pleckstrin-like domain